MAFVVAVLMVSLIFSLDIPELQPRIGASGPSTGTPAFPMPPAMPLISGRARPSSSGYIPLYRLPRLLSCSMFRPLSLIGSFMRTRQTSIISHHVFDILSWTIIHPKVAVINPDHRVIPDQHSRLFRCPPGRWFQKRSSVCFAWSSVIRHDGRLCFHRVSSAVEQR